MSTFKDEDQHKKNLKDLGRMGGVVVAYFAAIYLAIYFNMDYSPKFPWFLIVILVGGFFVVPRARAVMRAFEENAKDQT